jgi:hypothetical protein
MDAIIILAVFLLCLGVPFALAGLWWWFIFWWFVGGLLGGYELVSKIKTGKTISQRFWDWRKDPKTPAWKKWLIGVGMVGFWGYLLGHLYLGW